MRPRTAVEYLVVVVPVVHHFSYGAGKAGAVHRKITFYCGTLGHNAKPTAILQHNVFDATTYNLRGATLRVIDLPIDRWRLRSILPP